MSKVNETLVPDAPPDPTAATDAPAVPVVPASLGDYLRVWVSQLRGGNAGILPVLLGLVLISVIFQSLNSHFLTAGNLVNLGVQGAVFMLLAMAEVTSPIIRSSEAMSLRATILTVVNWPPMINRPFERARSLTQPLTPPR